MTSKFQKPETGTGNAVPADCWKRIGVWGNENPRCSRLEQVIHCRNCEIFTQAGRNLLERSLPEKYQKEWTEVMSARKEEDIPGTVSVIIFRIEEEWLALRTRVLAEVIDPENLYSHTLPHRRNPVLIGIINVHGEIQLCVSLKTLLGIEDSPREKENRKAGKRMVVVNSNSGQWVFPVDEILGIYRIHPGTFQNVPVTVAKAQSTFTKGIFNWENRHVAFLDHDLLLYALIRNVQ